MLPNTGPHGTNGAVPIGQPSRVEWHWRMDRTRRWKMKESRKNGIEKARKGDRWLVHSPPASGELLDLCIGYMAAWMEHHTAIGTSCLFELTETVEVRCRSTSPGQTIRSSGINIQWNSIGREAEVSCRGVLAWCVYLVLSNLDPVPSGSDPARRALWRSSIRIYFLYKI